MCITMYLRNPVPNELGIFTQLEVGFIPTFCTLNVFFPEVPIINSACLLPLEIAILFESPEAAGQRKTSHELKKITLQKKWTLSYGR